MSEFDSDINTILSSEKGKPQKTQSHGHINLKQTDHNTLVNSNVNADQHPSLSATDGGIGNSIDPHQQQLLTTDSLGPDPPTKTLAKAILSANSHALFEVVPSESQINALARRIETRIHSSLSDYNKLSHRLARISNAATASYKASEVAQDIGFWENEIDKRERQIQSSLSTLHAIAYILSQYPTYLSEQQGAVVPHQLPAFECDASGRFPPLPPPHSGLTAKQLSSFRRIASLINDFQIEYLRYKQLCEKCVVQMKLFLDRDDSDLESGLHSHHLLQNENKTLHSAVRATNQIINTAQSTDGSLRRQRFMFSNILSQISSVGDRFPVINNTLSAINNRRNRDNLILSSLIAFLLFLTLLYLINK